MKTRRPGLWLVLSAGLGLAACSGCQTWNMETGLTLPTGRYLRHYPTYTPPSPPFPLMRELRSLEEAAAAEARGAAPLAPAAAPAPGIPAPPPPAGLP